MRIDKTNAIPPQVRIKKYKLSKLFFWKNKMSKRHIKINIT